MGVTGPSLVLSASCPPGSSWVLWYARVLHHPVEPLHVDVGEHRASYPPWGATAQGWVVGPGCAVSRLQGSCAPPQEAVVVEVLSKDVPQDGMVALLKASCDVSFAAPLGACPGLADLVQGRVASPGRS